jgi:NAD(P)-dependent dehydrogenase (short-subunit alcohol dehydrogenase family)
MTTVLITGASSGLGMAAALAFARRNDTVYATVRSEEKAAVLRERAAGEDLQVHTRILDVTRTKTFPGLIDGIVNEAGRIDVLVNNAGIIHPGAWEDLTETAAREVMETNFFGPMFLARAVLPHMRSQGGGYIIMISSLSGLAGLAGDVAYTASKFALEGATEALRHEVDRWGIRVALVEAGQYATDLFNGKEELPPNYPGDSPYRALVASKLREFRAGKSGAMPAANVGDLLPRIADSDGSQLRWAADDVARYVLSRAHGLSDSERDEFLRGASGSDWWSRGEAQPDSAESGG